MKIRSTSEDLRKLSFVDNLYKQLRQQTKSAIEDHNRMIVKASNYLEDGLSDSECAELLVIEGSNRIAAENCVQSAKSNEAQLDGRHEYSFYFEDVYGKTWSSYDINRVVRASSDEEAWEKAESAILEDPSIEPEKVVSVDRIS